MAYGNHTYRRNLVWDLQHRLDLFWIIREHLFGVKPGANIKTLRDTRECEACPSAAQGIDAGKTRPFPVQRVTNTNPGP